MNSLEEMLAHLNTPEMKAKLAAITELDDHEQQGYEGAQYIIAAAGITPEELLYSTVRDGEPSRLDVNIKRTTGIIRWCLEQRRKG